MLCRDDTIQYRTLEGDTGETAGGHWCGKIEYRRNLLRSSATKLGLPDERRSKTNTVLPGAIADEKPTHPPGPSVNLRNALALVVPYARSHSPLSSHTIGLADGAIPNRASSAAAAKLTI